MRRPPELDKGSHSVHYTLLIACVLVAFVLGAVLSGSLVSCYCSRPARRSRKLAKDPEAPIPHALSLRSLAKLNGLLDSKDEKLDASTPQIYSSLFGGAKEPPGSRRSQLLPPPSELSGLPTPDSTPELPIKSMKAFRNQWEKNHNCNNAKEPRPLGARGGPALLHPQVFPYARGVSGPQAEERKVHSAERLLSQQPYLDGCQKVMEVTSLDELLKHIHRAGGGGGGASKSSPLVSPPGLYGGAQLAFSNRVQPQIPETESAPYYSSSTLPRDSLSRRMDVPPDLPPPQQSTLERRHASQRHPLLTGAGGGVVPRQHPFGQRGGVPHQPPLLARINSSGSACEAHYPLMANGYLSRQHSYSGEQHELPQRGALLRRTPSLKPDVPPKPLFIPATSPVSQQGKFY